MIFTQHLYFQNTRLIFAAMAKESAEAYHNAEDITQQLVSELKESLQKNGRQGVGF